MHRYVTTGFLFAAALAFGQSLTAATVNRRDGTLRGNVQVADGQVIVDSQRVDWPEVVSLKSGHERIQTAANAVVLLSGDIWRGRVVSLRRSRLTVDIEPFGLREIDLQLVAAIALQPGLAVGPRPSPGKLIQRNGRPMSAKLQRITDTHVLCTSSFGKFKLPRTEVVQYVLTDRAGPPRRIDHDEILLINGTRVHARSEPSGNGFSLQSPSLGEAFAAYAALFSVRRYPRDILRLSDQPWEVVAAQGPLGPADPPRRLLPAANADISSDSPWVDAMRFDAGTTVRIDLGRAVAGRLSFALQAGQGNLGKATFSIASGDARIGSWPVVPGASPAAVSVELPARQRLDCTLAFDGPARLPCTALIANPTVVATD